MSRRFDETREKIKTKTKFWHDDNVWRPFRFDMMESKSDIILATIGATPWKFGSKSRRFEIERL